MSSPLAFVGVPKTYGGIKGFANRVIFINKQPYAREFHLLCPCLRGHQQTSGNALSTVFRQNGQRVKIKFARLGFIVHT